MKQQYYYVQFRYKNKEAANIFCGDFVLEEGSSYAKLQKRGEELFYDFMRKTFPKEVVKAMPVPEHLIVVPGYCFTVNTHEGKDHGSE